MLRSDAGNSASSMPPVLISAFLNVANDSAASLVSKKRRARLPPSRKPTAYFKCGRCRLRYGLILIFLILRSFHDFILGFSWWLPTVTTFDMVTVTAEYVNFE